MEESLFMRKGLMNGKATKKLSIPLKAQVKYQYSFHGLKDISDIFT